jgi:proprotein convertase subtilisin/kexin type 5
MYVVVQVRLCHAWCKACFGDGPTACYSCNYVDYFTKLSNKTCALTCLAGFGNDTNVPDTCIQCATNCSSCLDISTNCTVCYSGFYLLPNVNGTGCIGTCPSRYYPNNTAPATCIQCDANCFNCTSTSTICTSCNTG